MVENVKVGFGSVIVPEGPVTIEVWGGVVSTVIVCDAGEPSWLPALSVARTSKVCGPSASGGSVRGPEQVTQAPPSTRHS